MSQNNAQFYDYFLQNLEMTLEKLILTDLRTGSSNNVRERGKKLFKKNPSATEEESSVNFMILLQECYKTWGTTLDESIPAAGKLIERFYELLDKGAIEFTDENILYGKDAITMGILDNN